MFEVTPKMFENDKLGDPNDPWQPRKIFECHHCDEVSHLVLLTH